MLFDKLFVILCSPDNHFNEYPEGIEVQAINRMNSANTYIEARKHALELLSSGVVNVSKATYMSCLFFFRSSHNAQAEVSGKTIKG